MLYNIQLWVSLVCVALCIFIVSFSSVFQGAPRFVSACGMCVSVCGWDVGCVKWVCVILCVFWGERNVQVRDGFLDSGIKRLLAISFFFPRPDFWRHVINNMILRYSYQIRTVQISALLNKISPGLFVMLFYFT